MGQGMNSTNNQQQGAEKQQNQQPGGPSLSENSQPGQTPTSTSSRARTSSQVGLEPFGPSGDMLQSSSSRAPGGPSAPDIPASAQQIQVSFLEINQAFASIPPMVTRQMRKELNMDEKDGNSLTLLEKQRIVGLFRSRQGNACNRGTNPPNPAPTPSTSSQAGPVWCNQTANTSSNMESSRNPPGLNSSSQSSNPPNTAQLNPGVDLFSIDFINSVARSLDDSMFRADGDENFERDFGQWFNGEDDVGGIDSSTNPAPGPTGIPPLSTQVSPNLNPNVNSGFDHRKSTASSLGASDAGIFRLMESSLNPPRPNPGPSSGPLNLAPFNPGADLFSTDFINSVASSLDEFDGNMFRPDGDINFERDFGHWFNGDDDGDDVPGIDPMK